MDRVRRVPDSIRRFSLSVSDARRVHSVDAVLLDRLLDLGLPHRRVAGELMFDEYDLSNIGVELNLPSARRRAMRWWSKAFERVVPGVPVTCRIECLAQCPAPGHAGACSFELSGRLTAGIDAGTLHRTAPDRYRFDVTRPNRMHLFGDAFTPLIEQGRRLRFHLLPPDEDLASDLGFLAETGLTDCRMAAMTLGRLAEKLGLPTRGATGFMITPPVPQPHGWLEFYDDGEWWAADPFLLNALARWGVLDGGQWPPDRSPDGVMWRLHERWFDIVRHGSTGLVPKLFVVRRTDVAAIGGTVAAGR